MLDEMTINNVKRFAMVKISETEDKLITATAKIKSVYFLWNNHGESSNFK